MQWSWELLDATEQRALAWCSTFQGDFTLELCERLLPDDVDAVDVLQSLKRKSLVTLRPGTDCRSKAVEATRPEPAPIVAQRRSNVGRCGR